MEVDDPLDQPCGEGRFFDGTVAGALFPPVGIDQHAIDHFGVHGFQGIGHDGVEALPLEFLAGVSGELPRRLEGEPDAGRPPVPSADLEPAPS